MTPYFAMPVKLLDRSVINKLDAQTSLLSFSSCVEELVKNSIDAKATVIHVNLNSSQLSINVTDNGRGILYKDLETVATSHFTSNVSDLAMPSTTYGFRGKALADTSHVSLLTIESKVASEPQYSVSIHRSKRFPVVLKENAVDLDYAFRQQFTRVTVRNLFSNVPVRQRLMAQMSTKLVDQVKRELVPLILNHNEITFKVIDQDQESPVLTVLKTGSFQNRAIQLFNQLHDFTVPQWHSVQQSIDCNFSITGIIAHKPVPFKAGQYIFVNSTPMPNAGSILKQVNDLFASSKFAPLKKRIHNGKAFSEPLAYPAFILAVRLDQTLSERIEGRVQGIAIQDAVVKVFEDFLDSHHSESTARQRRLPFQTTKQGLKTDGDFQNGASILKLSPQESSKYFSADRSHRIERGHLISAKAISQVDSKFILVKLAAEQAPLLALLDQHAVDERILFDDLLNTFTSNPISVKLLSPISLSSSLRDLDVQYLSLWGFRVSETALTHLPEILWEYRSDAEYIRDIVAKCVAEENSKSRSTPSLASCPAVLVSVMASKCCRSALKFGDRLTPLECQYLLDRLANCNCPFQCAHGRPTIVPIAHLSSIFNDF